MKTKSRSFRVYGHVPAGEGKVIIATDGAVDQSRSSVAFVSTSGHYGVLAHVYGQDISKGDRPVVAELRAIHEALKYVTPKVSGPIRILTDNQYALKLLNSWKNGEGELPAGYRTWRYSGNTSSLELLRGFVASTPRLSFRHIQGHAGHPLNETADSLAKLGLRVSKGMVPKDRAEVLAEMWAKESLKAFRQEMG